MDSLSSVVEAMLIRSLQCTFSWLLHHSLIHKCFLIKRPLKLKNYSGNYS